MSIFAPQKASIRLFLIAGDKYKIKVMNTDSHNTLLKASVAKTMKKVLQL